MPELEILFWKLTAVGIVLGAAGIVLARVGTGQRGVLVGRVLFLAALLLLGSSGLMAAFHRADGLVPLGLSAGFLVTGMLWELPREAGPRAEVWRLPEEI